MYPIIIPGTRFPFSATSFPPRTYHPIFPLWFPQTHSFDDIHPLRLGL